GVAHRLARLERRRARPRAVGICGAAAGARLFVRGDGSPLCRALSRDGRQQRRARGRVMPKLVVFCHSLRSDWNHGNAHFLRGVLSECYDRGFAVLALEPAEGWSAGNLSRDCGPRALDAWRQAYPPLPLEIYDPVRLDLDRVLESADLVLVHEWNEPELIARIAAHRKSGGSYLLLFHDTHHRMVSAPEAIGAMELDGFDGVLAFGAVLREAYLRQGWGRQAFTWHEAADLRIFGPRPAVPQ